MKIDIQLKDALKSAVQKCGGQSSFARKHGISKQAVSKYLNGSISELTIDTWKKICSSVEMFLPPGYIIEADDYHGGRLTQLREVADCFSAVRVDADGMMADLVLKCAEYGLNFNDDATCLLLRYWNKLDRKKRFLLLERAAELTDDDQASVKKMAGDQVS